jgi:hypothetical protein
MLLTRSFRAVALYPSPASLLKASARSTAAAVIATTCMNAMSSLTTSLLQADPRLWVSTPTTVTPQLCPTLKCLMSMTFVSSMRATILVTSLRKSVVDQAATASTRIRTLRKCEKKNKSVVMSERFVWSVIKSVCFCLAIWLCLVLPCVSVSAQSFVLLQNMYDDEAV